MRKFTPRSGNVERFLPQRPQSEKVAYRVTCCASDHVHVELREKESQQITELVFAVDEAYDFAQQILAGVDTITCL